MNELQTEIDEMKSTIDEHEQYCRRNSLRISGVNETTNEDIVDVTFATHRARQLVYRNKAYLNPRRTPDLQAGAWGRGDTSSQGSDRHSYTPTDDRQRVWINEDLT